MKSIFTAINFIDTDACSVFDCDLQDDPNLLSRFIESWEKGNKIIYGKRNKRQEFF